MSYLTQISIIIIIGLCVLYGRFMHMQFLCIIMYNIEVYSRLTLNLKAASLNMNSSANIAVKIILSISSALLYSAGWLWYFIARVIVLIMMRTKIAYSKGCDVTNHQTLYWMRCFGMYLKNIVFVS